MKSPRLKKLIVVLLILSIAVCLLPFPQRISWNMTGNAVEHRSEEGNITDTTLAEPVTMEIKGWYFRFLLLKDKIGLRYTVEDGNGTHEFKHRPTAIFDFVNGDGSKHHSFGTGYIKDGTKLRSVLFVADESWNRLVLEISDSAQSHLYTVATEEGADLTELLKHIS